MQRSPCGPAHWRRVMAGGGRSSCCFGFQPPSDGADLAWYAAPLPCPGEEDALGWLQVDVRGGELGGELVASCLSCAAADDPCGAVGHGGDLPDGGAHGGGAEFVLVEDEVSGCGVVPGVGGLAGAGWSGDEDDASHHAVACLGSGSWPPFAGSPT